MCENWRKVCQFLYKSGNLRRIIRRKCNNHGGNWIFHFPYTITHDWLIWTKIYILITNILILIFVFFFLKKTKPSSSSIHHHERMWPMFPSTILKHYHHIRWVLSLLLLCVCTFGFHSLLILDNGGGGASINGCLNDAWWIACFHDFFYIFFYFIWFLLFFSLHGVFFYLLSLGYGYFFLLLLMMNVWEIIFIQTNLFFSIFFFLNQNTLDEIITTTAYLDLFIRTTSEPKLIRIFLEFLCFEVYDNNFIISTKNHYYRAPLVRTKNNNMMKIFWIIWRILNFSIRWFI